VGAVLLPESYLQLNLRFVRVSLRIHFDFFDYASVLFLRPEVFTEHRMRLGWHGHRERGTDCPGGMAMDSTRRGSEHGQQRPWPGGTVLRQWQWLLGRLWH
jgi:hypothetical protein